MQKEKLRKQYEARQRAIYRASLAFEQDLENAEPEPSRAPPPEPVPQPQPLPLTAASQVSACVVVPAGVCVCDWTLGAAAYPSRNLAMSVGRHTEGAR